ncbi:serine/threonine-protein kinase [Actinoplanes nipponensis]|nr:serine/threonine-protein kinase [Actinoplanes nipponensis]
MEVQQQMLGGRYTLVDELGRGGMAVVWRGRDEVLGRAVAVKVLAGRYAGNPQSRARIRDEARAAATLSHPAIAQVYDFGESEEDGRRVPYVVMELVHGVTLQQRMKDGPIPPAEIFRVGAQVAAALAAAHADGLVHRDIKPGNVMVTGDGAKVVDFGLAAAAGPADPDDEVFGTPAYLAPERLTGGPVEPASDVYALGVLMYRLLAGESPFAVDTTTQMLSAHVYVEPAPLPPLESVPPPVTDLVNRCLRKDPAERPSAAQAAGVLRQAAGTGAGAEPPPGVAVPRRPGGRLILGCVAAAVASVALLWTLLPGGAGRESEAAAPPTPSVSGRVGTGAAPPGPAATATRPAAGAPEPTRAAPSAAPSAVGTASAPAAESPRASAPGPEPTPTAEPTSAEPTATARTFTSRGGSVEARCDTAGQAELISWTAADRYEVQKVDEGPAPAAEIVFKKAKSRIRMTVTCVDGDPTVAVLPL